jgi:hypothetical protein
MYALGGSCSLAAELDRLLMKETACDVVAIYDAKSRTLSV